MTEFDDHSGPVNDVEFHPHEFLLASASNDRYVNFWDLEQFKLVSSSERDSGPVRWVSKICYLSISLTLIYEIIIAMDFALSSRHSGEVDSLVECGRGWKKVGRGKIRPSLTLFALCHSAARLSAQPLSHHALSCRC